MLTYIKWQYVGIDASSALSSFQEWPWFRATIIFTLFTYLYSFYAYVLYIKQSVKIEQSAAVYAVLYIWIFFFVFYPGADSFGGSDSNSWFWMIGIQITHYYAVKLFTKELIKQYDKG